MLLLNVITSIRILLLSPAYLRHPLSCESCEDFDINLILTQGKLRGLKRGLLLSWPLREKFLLPPLVLTTFWFFTLFKKSYNFIKNEESYWLPHFNHFCTPQKPPKSTTTKKYTFFKRAFSLERCRKNHFWHSHAAWQSFFCLIPMQRGSAKTNFCDTSPARMRFFKLLPHVPSGKLRNHENAILESLSRRHVVNYENRKSL